MGGDLAVRVSYVWRENVGGKSLAWIAVAPSTESTGTGPHNDRRRRFVPHGSIDRWTFFVVPVATKLLSSFLAGVVPTPFHTSLTPTFHPR
jgi:hypothetical protein